jgi:hypothetical protein
MYGKNMKEIPYHHGQRQFLENIASNIKKQTKATKIISTHVDN